LNGDSGVGSEVQRFVVIATPRSGSNWLCTLLDSHPQILCHHELFNPDGVHIARSLRDTGFDIGGLELQRSHPLELLERAWSKPLEFSHLGFKLNIDQPAEVFSAVIKDPSIRKILVSRLNRVRAFVSECIAEASGQWESYPESARPSRPLPVQADPARLLEHARRNAEFLGEIRKQLASHGQESLEIFYESIGQDDTHRRILEYLGARPDVPLRGRTRRMNPEPLSDLVRNYDELATALADTDLASDLEA